MLQKLAKVEDRYEELNRKLADPEVTRDQELLRELSKEHADIQKLVAVARELRKVTDDISGTKEMLEAESDGELLAMAKEELRALEQQRDELEEQARILLLPKDPNDHKNVILEIRAGTGGDEASLFAGDLYRMYVHYAEQRGYRTEIMAASEGGHGGYKEIILMIQGQGAFSDFKYESGVHRVQRVPATESQGRIHTSACTVAVLPEAEEVDIELKDNELRIDVYRSSGPGGQSVNTTDSAVRITHIPTGMVVAIQDEKSQHKNKAKALRILRSRLLEARQAEEEAKRSAARKNMVKSGDRSEKVRTYNFPQDRMTDHRIGLTLHNLPNLLSGELDPVVTALRTHFQTAALESGSH